MKKTHFALFLFILGMAFAPSCFSQNMLLFGGDYNLMIKPETFNVGIGFNIKLYEEYVQNDFIVNFGGIRVRYAEKKHDETEPTEPIESIKSIESNEPDDSAIPMKFLFSVKDNLYYNKEWKWIGLRAGVYASFGVYGIRDSLTVYDLFFSIGGLAGICILPRALISMTLDIFPGYALTFGNVEELSVYEAGFSLPLSFYIRFNFDKW